MPFGCCDDLSAPWWHFLASPPSQWLCACELSPSSPHRTTSSKPSHLVPARFSARVTSAPRCDVIMMLRPCARRCGAVRGRCQLLRSDLNLREKRSANELIAFLFAQASDIAFVDEDSSIFCFVLRSVSSDDGRGLSNGYMNVHSSLQAFKPEQTSLFNFNVFLSFSLAENQQNSSHSNFENALKFR